MELLEIIGGSLAGIITLLSVVFAALQNSQLKKAEVSVTQANAVVEQVVSFYDSENTTPVPEEIINQLPPRSWKMSDSTKRWVLSNHDIEDQATLLKQIEAAELLKKVSYTISCHSAYYCIEYGLIKESGTSGKQ